MNKRFTHTPVSLRQDDRFLDLPSWAQRDLVMLYYSLHPFGCFRLTERAWVRRTAADCGDLPQTAADWRGRVQVLCDAGLGLVYTDGEGVEHFGLAGYDDNAPGRLVARRGEPPCSLPQPAANCGKTPPRQDKTRQEERETRARDEDTAPDPPTTAPDPEPTPVTITTAPSHDPDAGDPLAPIAQQVQAWLTVVAEEQTDSRENNMGIDHTAPGPFAALTRDLYPQLVSLLRRHDVDQIAAGLDRHKENRFNMSRSLVTVVRSLEAQIRHVREEAHRNRRLAGAIAEAPGNYNSTATEPWPVTSAERTALDNYWDAEGVRHKHRDEREADREAMAPIMAGIRADLAARFSTRVQA